MNKYDVTSKIDGEENMCTIEADGFQIGPHGGNIIFIEKSEKGEVVATHYVAGVTNVTKIPEVS